MGKSDGQRVETGPGLHPPPPACCVLRAACCVLCAAPNSTCASLCRGVQWLPRRASMLLLERQAAVVISRVGSQPSPAAPAHSLEWGRRRRSNSARCLETSPPRRRQLYLDVSRQPSASGRDMVQASHGLLCASASREITLCGWHAYVRRGISARIGRRSEPVAPHARPSCSHTRSGLQQRMHMF